MAKKSKMMQIMKDDGRRQVIALYARVSTDRQAEEGYSLEIQRERLTAYARSLYDADAELRFYVDDGFSGGNLERPEITRLIDDVKKKDITHVIVMKLDRLSRSQKDTLYLIEDVFLPHNTAFVSMQESFATDTPFGRAMVGILSVFAQLERENIYERTRSGMAKRVESGYWPGGGRIPFGYDYSPGEGILVPNEDADTVRKVYELYIEGYSLQTIANMVGLKYERLAYQILTRKSNTGVITYKGGEYKGRHQAIVSPEVYDQAMAALSERSSKRLVSATDHLLTGLVYCGVCGARMRYMRWGKAGYKLYCYSRQSSKPYLVRDPDCANEGAWADEVEDAVLADVFLATERIEADEQEELVSGAVTVLRDQQELEEKKLRRLYRLYSEAGDDLLLSEIEEIKKRRDMIKEKLEQEEARGLISQGIKRARLEVKNLRGLWDYMTVRDRQRAIRAVVDRVTVTENEVHIEYKL